MDIVILVGGRGRRLGALTHNKQKGVLRFKGKPLIVHIIDALLKIGGAEHIYVATGYRTGDVHNVLGARYFSQLTSGEIRIVDGSHITGTLSRLAYVAQSIHISNGCMVMGIDGIIPQKVIGHFLHHAQTSIDKPLVLASPRLSIAPTHYLLRMKNKRVVEYFPPMSESSIESDWYVDVGIRYIPRKELAKIRRLDAGHRMFIPQFITSLLLAGKEVNGFTFTESWSHFGVAMDFVKMPLPQ